ncbi:MAG TPA: flagellar hook protein FlgE [Bacteroidota bacterium]|nr:flagellar hook protein FlgE [Bacteroidota bacterium]
MSFLRSLFSGVSGLMSQQTMMDVIGNNIANINTIGFKAGRATFSELYAQTLRGATQPTTTNGGTNPMQVGLGTTVSSINTMFTQGAFQNTGVSTDLALSGPAFFIVNQNGQQLYTRVGSFQFDSNGMLTNPGTGAVVQGKLADAVGNIPSGTALQNIQIPADTKGPAVATTTAELSGNLDASAAVGTAIDTSILVYDSLGNQTNVKVTFTKTADNAWSWTATAPAPATTASSGTVTFNTDGSLNNVTGNPVVVTPGTGAPDISFTLNLGKPSATVPGNFSGLTQASGDSAVNLRNQDGSSSGTLQTISIESSGIIRGAFSNGAKRALGQIMLAEFNNPSGLVKVGDDNWTVSGNSGTAAIVNPGGTTTIQSNALEQSNVDLSQEFTNMITAERGFQANARVITTSDQILQEVVNLIR